MEARTREILRIADKAFVGKDTVNTLHQEIAYNFYPERADFTTQRDPGEEFNDNFASFPQIVRRDLGNMISALTRPEDSPWGSIHVDNEELDEEDGNRKFLEGLTKVQRKAMYDPRAGFVRATKQGDHDYVTFGNVVIYGSPNSTLDAMMFRNYHLRDCAWMENAEGAVDTLFRKWMPTAHQLKQLFLGSVSDDVMRACEKEPDKKFECKHVVMPTRLYRYKDMKTEREYPFTSLFVECASEKILEEKPLNYFPYVVARWHTIADTVYGRSPVTEIALPDGRTMQVVTRTLREAGEKYVDPPLLQVQDALRSDVNSYPGGITTVSAEYDERLGEVLRPLTQDRHGVPIGFEIANALKEDLRQAFYLNTLGMPDFGNREVTAFEYAQRLRERIRESSPLLEPINHEYNNALWELSFNILMDNGGLPMHLAPESLKKSGAGIKFKFRTPLQEMEEQAEAASFADGLTRILVPAMQIDPAQVAQMNMTKATRDSLRSVGWKADWFGPEEAVDEERQRMREMQEMQQQIALAGQAGAAVEQGGKAGQAVKDAMGENQ